MTCTRSGGNQPCPSIVAGMAGRAIPPPRRPVKRDGAQKRPRREARRGAPPSASPAAPSDQHTPPRSNAAAAGPARRCRARSGRYRPRPAQSLRGALAPRPGRRLNVLGFRDLPCPRQQAPEAVRRRVAPQVMILAAIIGSAPGTIGIAERTVARRARLRGSGDGPGCRSARLASVRRALPPPKALAQGEQVSSACGRKGLPARGAQLPFGR